MRITFVSPHHQEEKFWKLAQDFARAVAKDLNIEFSVIHNQVNNRSTYLDAYKKAFNAPQKPDYVIGIMLRTLAKPILDLSREHHIPVFMVNTDTPKEEKQSTGKPREIYPNFIGHMFPDEKRAGALLVKQLIEIAQKKHPDETIQVLGLTGHRESQVSEDRASGLKAGVAQSGANLKQLVYTNWSAQDAFQRSKKLIRRHSGLHVLWYGSDAMALEARKLSFSHVYTIGGFDWTPEALEAIKKGEVDVSVGGHFTEIGLALILLYDHYHHRDFTDQFKLPINTQMIALTQQNIDQYYDILISQNWDYIDFKSLSKVLNPSLEKYDFSFQNIFKHTQATTLTAR